jgi:hypothetical protein
MLVRTQWIESIGRYEKMIFDAMHRPVGADCGRKVRKLKARQRHHAVEQSQQSGDCASRHAFRSFHWPVPASMIQITTNSVASGNFSLSQTVAVSPELPGGGAPKWWRLIS